MRHAPHPRSAIVTGSARRVGRAIAAGLIAGGWRVVVHARDPEAARRAADELGAAGWVAADLDDPDACSRLVAEAMPSIPSGLDLLVNSASAFELGDPLATDAAVWDAEFAVTARAPLLVTRAAHPYLGRARQRTGISGLVVNVSDRAAREHWSNRVAHAAAKAALESLTIASAKAFAPHVRVCAIAPGNVLAPDDQPDMVVDTPPELLVGAILELADDRTRSGEIITW